MRPLLALLLALPLPAFAETIETASRVSAVTLYPYGAQVSRRIAVEAGAGAHTLIVPDLPRDTDADSLRVLAPEGVRVGGLRLATGRQPATGDLTPPEVQAARAEVERLESALRDGEQKVALMRLRAEAADAEALFYRSVGKEGPAPAGTPEDLRALAEAVGSGILAAREAALEAGHAADAADRALDADREALEAARRHLAALSAEPETGTLTLDIETGAAGPVDLTILSFTAAATWRPVYDLRLTRGGTPELTVERGVVVEQQSGEDWPGVTLTLSTARPSDRSAPSEVWPQQMSILDEKSYYGSGSGGYDRAAAAPALAEAPAPAPVAPGGPPEVSLAGVNVTYAYPGTVDLRSGVDALRLSLDSLTLAPEVMAAAAPLWDDTAYVLAVARNTSPEVLLPGEAVLWFEGQMAGTAILPLVAAGDETEIGFGPIDGLRLSRAVPDRSTGDSGVISKVNQLDEVVRIEVKNLTGESWPVRLLDRVPYSEQDDLAIRWSAEPMPGITDWDDKRGVLAWTFDLAPGEAKVIRLAWQARWPSGYILQ